MKEKTIYALLMTMIPGLALAAEEQDRPGKLDGTPTTQRTREVEETPITKKIKKRTEEAMDSLPRTPDLQAKVNQRINRRILPPEKADFYFKLGFDQEVRKKEELKREVLADIKNEEAQLRLQRQMSLSQEQKKLSEELERKLAENETLAMEAERSIEEQIKENENLSLMINSLRETIEKQSKDLEESQMALTEGEGFTLSIIKDLEEEVIRKAKNIEEKQQQLRELEKKAGILQSKTERLESELQNTKVIEEDLKSKLQGVVTRQKKGNSSSFSTPLNPISIPPSVPSASISDTSVAEPSSSSILPKKQENQKTEVPNEEI